MGADYLLLDGALKWEALDCGFLGDLNVLIIPAIEVHRSKLDSNEVKKTTARIDLEVWWGQLRTDNPGDRTGDPWRPLVRIDFGETRDSVKRKKFAKAGLLVGAVSALAGYPAGAARWGCTSVPPDPCPLRFRWSPFVGVEYYDSLPVERPGLPVIESINTTLAVARIALEWWPFRFEDTTRKVRAPIQLSFDYSARRRINGERLPEASADLLTIGLTYYLDAKQQFGIGLEREDGASPVRNFVDEERTSLSLKVRL